MAREWTSEFLASLTLVPNVTLAAREAGITRKAAYLARDSDPEFKAAWDAALEESTDALVERAYSDALAGNTTLMIFLLKCHRRDVYGDQVKTDVTSGGDKVQTVFYIPENGRDPDPGDQAPAGPAGSLPVDAG